jgi:hypothetical protein
MLNKRLSPTYALALVVCLAAMAGCNIIAQYTCVNCHTDRQTLEEVADPVDYPPPSGEG